MPNLLRNVAKSLGVLAVWALSLLFVSPALFAAEKAANTTPNASQTMDVSTFLNTLSLQDQGLTGNPSLVPAPQDKGYFCGNGCGTGKACWFCNNNWVCVYSLPDPHQPPPGCSGGTV
jgi:hypothetical protein